jgi:hypothetical protein
LSKESKIKKRLEKAAKPTVTLPPPPENKRDLTTFEKAQVIRYRLANRPVLVFRYPNGELNKRFVYSLLLLLVALIAALYFVSRP